MVLVVAFVSALILVAYNYTVEEKVTKEQQLMSELKVLRSGLKLFTVVENRKPKDLIELCSARFTFLGDGRNQGFVELGMIEIDDKGRLIDPYGNSFAYDEKTLWVASTTPGFKDW